MQTAMTIALAAVKTVVLLGSLLTVGALLTLLERRLSAMIQDRVGPNRADLRIGGRRFTMGGLLHPAADGIKMLFKEDFVPAGARVRLFQIAPAFPIFFTIAAFAVVPVAGDVDLSSLGLGKIPLQIADLNVGLLFMMGVSSLAIYGAVLGGWASNSKYSLLGGMRAAAQMISYEAVIGLSLVGAVMAMGTASMRGIVDAQSGVVLGVLPRWGITLQPLGFLIFFAAAMAETKRVPFDIPEGEAEIIGYFIEYSGLKFAMFFLGEFIEVALAGVLMALVYFGGWQLPWLPPESYQIAAPYVLIAAGLTAVAAGVIAVRGHGAKAIGVVLFSAGALPIAIGVMTLVLQPPEWAVSIVTAAAQLTVFCVKAAFLIWLQFMVRWTLPRFRFDQLLSIGWKKLVPWSLANIVLTGAIIIWVNG